MFILFFGFTKEFNNIPAGGSATIDGQVVSVHNSRPPDFTFHDGAPFPGAIVAINSMVAGVASETLFVGKTDDDSNFSISGLPAGDYQLAVFDESLGLVFGNLTILALANGETRHLDQVAVFPWFGQMHYVVFNDKDEDGFRDPDEEGILEQAVIHRFRDGTVYQVMPTDLGGESPFETVFPFFHWLVAEVDFARFKATGATIIVDGGGLIQPDNGWDMPSRNFLNPQPQAEVNPNTGNNLSRTEVGPVLTQAFQVFLGQKNFIEWGKSTYDLVDEDNEPFGNFPNTEDVDHNNNGLFDPSNGGISGMVLYATIRAEGDPRLAVAEELEAGIPRVQVALYRDDDDDMEIDDLDTPANGIQLADVDNYPLGWADGGAKGSEDVDHNGNGTFDLGDALNVTTTDSWDDSLPEGCQGDTFFLHGEPTDCYDGLRNYNQVRPGVFDGGYAFTSWIDRENANVERQGLPEGTYIVQAATPPSYELLKEEDINVVYGEEYEVNPLRLPPICVGPDHLVPPRLSLFDIPGDDGEAPYANETRPQCDFKQVSLSDGQNAAADFFLFTEVPVAAQVVGFVLNDLASEFDPASPTFGEKFSPSWLPVSIQDWTGREITRVYTDEFGAYNALLPSTFTVNLNHAYGESAQMLTVVINHPGPIEVAPGVFETDPQYNPQYSQFPYTFQYMPGTTTYLDTPVLPIAAFASAEQFPLDCELRDGTPVIYSVNGPTGGPYVSGTGQKVTIVSVGDVMVSNPLYEPGGTEPQKISRDYGFGNHVEDGVTGVVTIGGVPLENVIWTNGTIEGFVAPGTETGQLEIIRANGISTLTGVTVTVGPFSGAIHYVAPSTDPDATQIQDKIDIANPGDLILVSPGIYNEFVVMHTPVQLQGYGQGTIINGSRTKTEKLEIWREKVLAYLTQGKFDLLPNQGFNQDLPVLLDGPAPFFDAEGACITVAGKNTSESNGGFGINNKPRIDAISCFGAQGGGIFVNGYAHYLEIANCKLSGNYGLFGGGIRLGHPAMTFENDDGEIVHEHARNDHIKIRNSHIFANGGNGGAGGGISIYNGTDNYEISDNLICGNFTTGHGAGIGHLGLSRDGLIARNTIIFNESFSQQFTRSGGGISVRGNAPLGDNALSDGSGSVSITQNKIQGNHAGAGDGGGISCDSVNGMDVNKILMIYQNGIQLILRTILLRIM